MSDDTERELWAAEIAAAGSLAMRTQARVLASELNLHSSVTKDLLERALRQLEENADVVPNFHGELT